MSRKTVTKFKAVRTKRCACKVEKNHFKKTVPEFKKAKGVKNVII